MLAHVASWLRNLKGIDNPDQGHKITLNHHKTPATMQQPIHDRGYKRLFENPHFFQQLLESFVAKEWVKELDFSTCKSIKKSYVSPAHKETTKDMLYKVKFRGRDLYIYVLIEFQSNVQKFMIVRVLYYLASFYLDLIEQKDPPKKLPPIFPIILYNGKDKWTAPLSLDEVIEDADLLEEIKLSLRCHLIAENAFEPEELKRINNLVSTLFLGDAHYNEQDFKEAFLHLLDTHPDLDDVAMLLHWFLHLTTRGRRPVPDYKELRKAFTDKTKVTNMLEDALDEAERAGFQQGILQGREEGMEKGREEGMEKGILQGLEKGSEQANLKTATNMLRAGVAVTDIARWTGLAERVVLQLYEEMTKH